MPESTLHWLDYLVLAIFLAISLGIGVYHSLTGGKQKTTNEFIMANRALSVIPTALSMLVSYQSAIAVLGYTAEIYSYGTQFIVWMVITFSLAIFLAGLIFEPWIYPLKIVSINEYFYLRFRSRLLTVMGGILSIVGGILYMGVAMYAPSAALESVTGLPVVISVPLMAIVCVGYTTLGGMRAVIWTDVFQFFIMMGGILAILIKGVMVVGGFNNVFSLLEQQDRVFWIIPTPDPRVRHTVYEFLLGSTAQWTFSYALSQASVQRYSATTSINKARLSTFLNIPALAVFCSILSLIGMVATAYFIIIQCDPVESKLISNRNQLLPLFVTRIFSSSYGFSGLFLATLYGGALSTVSSSLSGNAANCWNDILKWKFDKMQETRKAFITRLLVILFGGIATGVAFLASTVPGPMTQIALSLNGCTQGPYLGLFLLGGLFRRSNWKSSLVGVICGLTVSVWLVLGSIVNKIKHPTLHSMPVSGCFAENSTSSFHYYTSPSSKSMLSSLQESTTQHGFNYESQPGPLQNFYSISYMWFIVIGVLTTVITGYLASFIICNKGDEKVIDDRFFISWKNTFSFKSRKNERQTSSNGPKRSSISLDDYN